MRKTKRERLHEMVQRSDNLGPDFQNPYVVQFFRDYEKVIVDRIAQTTIDQTAERNDLIAKLAAMREFRTFLEMSMAAGQTAREALRELDNG